MKTETLFSVGPGQREEVFGEGRGDRVQREAGRQGERFARARHRSRQPFQAEAHVMKEHLPTLLFSEMFVIFKRRLNKENTLHFSPSLRIASQWRVVSTLKDILSIVKKLSMFHCEA